VKCTIINLCIYESMNKECLYDFPYQQQYYVNDDDGDNSNNNHYYYYYYQ